MSDPLLLKKDEAAKRLGISRGQLDALIAEGSLPTVAIGKRHMICTMDLAAFVAGNRRMVRCSSSGKVRRTGSTSSSSKVFDIEEARRFAASLRR
ncbi:MAG: helix-turn-helix domain-containing protein [Brevundimonas sp.]|nr:helix-turn-helix domain-containing protein [Brevundimonas sp.]